MATNGMTRYQSTTVVSVIEVASTAEVSNQRTIFVAMPRSPVRGERVSSMFGC